MFNLLDRVDLSADPRGIYYDRGLVNNQVYTYYLVAEGQSGVQPLPRGPSA